MGDAALVLLVREELPAHGVAELVQMIRDKPGQLNCSTGGYGSQHHLATVTLSSAPGCRRTPPCTCRPPGWRRR